MLFRVAVIVVCVLSAPRLMAQQPDIEAMKRSLEAQISVFQRLNELERRVTDLEKKGGDRKSQSVVTPSTAAQDAPRSGAGQVSETTAPESLKTTVCRCQDYKEHLCLCLKAGVKCHCSRNVGSVWFVNEHGRATHKTGAKADPSGNATITRSDARSGSVKPSITIALADFYCPPCEAVKAMNWTAFNVTWQTGGASSYPQISWQDSRGVKRVLTGAYRPDQVMWSYRRTHQ